MKFRHRKLYRHSQNKSICLLQIPKIICEDLELTTNNIVDIDYEDKKIIISKAEDLQKV